MKTQNPAIEEALEILRGKAYTNDRILELGAELANRKALNYARRILERAYKGEISDEKIKKKIGHKYVVYTYKDRDLALVERLDRALEILKKVDLDLEHTEDHESLGIAGAIYKRKWEADGQMLHLERSLAYYKKGYKQNNLSDKGYLGINTAYILDLLAQQEESVEEKPEPGLKTSGHRTEAKLIRENIINKLTPLINTDEKAKNDYWYLVTMAEAYFGLKEYEKARPWLEKAYALFTEKENTSGAVPEWQLESTTRQLAQIVLLQSGKKNEKDDSSDQAWKELLLFSKVEPETLQTIFAGKAGLALSGGGFRASLYHIGVLARLAELDMLRHVEVLSCVSGGSIIGTHYYLEVKKLLESKPDNDIQRQDYIDIIQRISLDFLAGVQTNIRTRVALDPIANLKMLFSKYYSGTHRAGELYEEQLYSKIKDGKEKNIRWLDELLIFPLDNNKNKISNFNPGNENWKRKAKVPILILNATTLNTGHNWQFTATWMGEPPASIQKIDGNYRLRRMYLDDNPGERIRLGYAVAASACVPGLFEPLALDGIYPDKVVRLSDGGVHDNQGICGLLEQDCSVLLVSDASGQMSSIDSPPSSIWGVPMRSNDILMERVRNAQFQDLDNRKRSGVLKGLMFMHLKMDLDVQLIDWINCQEPSEPTSFNNINLTPYGIRRDVQALLASIRTDLDSFNDIEAFSLMCSGYKMCEHTFKQISGFPIVANSKTPWKFQCIEKELVNPSLDVLNILKVSKERMFKIWRLSSILNVIAWILGIGGLIGFLVLSFYKRTFVLLTLGTIGSTVVSLLLYLFLGKTFAGVIKYKETTMRLISTIGAGTLGFIGAFIHLTIFDRWYLARGKRKMR